MMNSGNMQPRLGDKGFIILGQSQIVLMATYEHHRKVMLFCY